MRLKTFGKGFGIAAIAVLICCGGGTLAAAASKQCPQPRFTEKAPDDIYNVQKSLRSD